MIQKRFRRIAIIGLLILLMIFGFWMTAKETEKIRQSAFEQMRLTLVSLKSADPDEQQIMHWIGLTTDSNPAWRVTWIATDGNVLFDSEIDAKLLGNHKDRPELQDAVIGEVGFSTRESNSLHQTYLYTAVQLENKSFIRLAVTESELLLKSLSFREPLFVLTIMLMLLMLILYRTAFGWFEHWTMYMRTIKDWRELHFLSRMDVLPDDPISPMAAELNQMAAHVQDQLRQRSIRFARLKTIVESMQTGVLLLDDRVRLVMMNDAAEQLLGFKLKESTVPRHLSELVPYEVLRWIEQSANAKERTEKEWHVYYPEDRILSVQLQPLPMLPDGEATLLVMIQDVTPLRRLEKIRSEFVANVSHELKTPIAAIRGFSETLLNGAINDQEAAQSFLQVILDESDRLNRLINGLLELSRLESRRAPLQFTRLHISELVNQSMKVVQNEADQKQIELITSVPQSLVIDADHDRLRQILLNLLSNAVHYTPDGGKVSVHAERMTDQGKPFVRLSVTDNGIGIHQDDIPRIFERFYRVDKARSRSSGGTGLGLSIVKHIVDLHQGAIHVESRLGKGSRFIIQLPAELHVAEKEESVS